MMLVMTLLKDLGLFIQFKKVIKSLASEEHLIKIVLEMLDNPITLRLPQVNKDGLVSPSADRAEQ